MAHSSGGLSHLFSIVEHSIIYSTIRRFIYHLPLPVVIALFAVAALGVVFRGGMIGKSGSKPVVTTVETYDKDGNLTGTRKTTKR